MSQDPIFDIIYSLPVLAHSVAVSTRTPTAGYAQQSKFMPDFGGVVELPTSAIKNNSLSTKLPFRSIPRTSGIRSFVVDDTQKKFIPNDCLCATSYLEADGNNQFLVIRGFGKNIFFDSVSRDFNTDSTQPIYQSTNYSSVPCPNNISGLKLSKSLRKHLLVKFTNGLKTIKLNKSFPNTHETDTDSAVPLSFGVSISDRDGFQLKDACLNPHSPSILSTASDNFEARQVKLYDLSSNGRPPFYEITWDSEENSSSPDSDSINRILRRRVVRKFLSNRPAKRGIQQIDNIPSHLVHLLVTTDHRVVLVDPRLNKLGQVYVDKSEVPSFYPIEFLRRTEFSEKNDYQFYSLTNVHTRVFDTRYNLKPVNQLNHMLDSDRYEALHMKIISNRSSDLETVCLSSSDRLCFSTFDQSQRGTLVNPRSVHLPYHEPDFYPNKTEDKVGVYGLDVLVNDKASLEKELFSIIHLSENGDILIRDYLDSQQEPGCLDVSQAKFIMQQSIPEILEDRSQRPYDEELECRDILDPDCPKNEVESIDILDSDVLIGIEDRLGSARALERYEKMKDKFDGGAVTF